MLINQQVVVWWLFPRTWIKREMPRLANALRRVLNSWQPEQVIEDYFEAEDLLEVTYELTTLDDCISSMKEMKMNLHQSFVDSCKKCLLYAANLANSIDKSEQEQQRQSDKMMEIAHMCFKELLRVNWSTRHTDLVMLVQLMLNNDLYASQENL